MSGKLQTEKHLQAYNAQNMQKFQSKIAQAKQAKNIPKSQIYDKVGDGHYLA